MAKIVTGNAPGPHPTRVDMELMQGYTSVLKLNGLDVSRLVEAVAVVAVPGRGPKVEITLSPHACRIASDCAAAGVDMDAAQLLVSLGWTPPAGARLSVAPPDKGVAEPRSDV